MHARAPPKACEVRADGDGLWSVTGGAFPSNTYICAADVPGGCILVDPGLDGPGIDTALTERGLAPRWVFCTHGHFDHAGSAAFFQKKYGAEVFLHKADTKTLKASNFLLMALKIPCRIEMPGRVTEIDDDFVRDIGGVPLRYHGAPGHTPGSSIIGFGDRFFTGDTVYGRGVGLSGLPGEDRDALRRSILRLWSLFEGDATVHPGHGRSATAVAVRTDNLPLLQFLGLADSGLEGQ